MIWKTVFILGILLGLSVHSKVKNILLIVSDDLKADALGCYGSEIAQTPYADQLAREGTLFENAYCQGTVCRPSRASFMRGRYRGKRKLLGANIFKKTVIQAPGWARSFTCAYRETSSQEPMATTTGMLVGQIQHAWKRGSHPGKLRLPEPQRIHNRTQRPPIHQDAVSDVRYR